MSRVTIYLDNTTKAKFDGWLSDYDRKSLGLEQELFVASDWVEFEKKERLKVIIYHKLGIVHLPPVLNLLTAIARKWQETRSDILQYAKAQEKIYNIVVDTSHFPDDLSYSIIEPATYKEITLSVLLENETTQKFNAWLKDCFQELDEFYLLASINSGIVYQFPKLALDKEYTNAVIQPLYDNQTAAGRAILLKWVEVGANFKLMITFPTDPRIINPLWDILFELCSDFPSIMDTVPYLIRDLRNKYQFEIPDINAAQVGAGKVERARQKIKIPELPKRKKDAYRWILVWEKIESKINDDPTLKIDPGELIQYLKENNLIIKDDTLRKIITRGKAKKMPPRGEFERKNKM